MEIQKFVILKEYLDWVDQVSEDIEDKSHFTPQEIVFKVCDIIKEINDTDTEKPTKGESKDLDFDFDDVITKGGTRCKAKQDTEKLLEEAREEIKKRYPVSSNLNKVEDFQNWLRQNDFMNGSEFIINKLKG